MEGLPAMQDRTDPAGMAALSLCDSLLRAINDKKLMTESEIMEVIADAAATHDQADGPASALLAHKSAAALIRRIVVRDDPNRRR